MNKLEPFQHEGADFMIENIQALNADDMGMGKTVQTIECFNRLKARKILIISLASVKYYWKTMIWAWADDLYDIQIVNTRSDYIRPEADIIIVNYELLFSDCVFKQLLRRKYAVGVADEAHYLQTLTSKRSKRVLGRGGLMERCVYKFMLSGTPMAARPIDLFPMMYTLANKALEPYNTYEKFAYRFCGAFKDFYGKIIARGATNLDDLGRRLKTFMIRRTDVGNLPDVVYDLIPFEPNEAVREVIDVERGLDNGKISQYSKLYELGGMASLRQQVAVAKLPECVQFIKDTLVTVDRLVVFYYHRSVGEILLDELHEYGVEFFKGGMPLPKKEKALDRFVNLRRGRIFLAQIQAAGESIDGLQKVCNHCIFVESSWIPKDVLQAVGRLRRKGSSGKPVIAQFLAAAGTIEYQILNSMIKKRQIIREVIDD